jgi:hypothetical protein
MFHDESANQRKIVHFSEQTYKKYLFSNILVNNPSICDGNEYYSTLPIPEDHASSFIDIDADCQNDLVIHSRTENFDTKTRKTVYTNFVEIWRGFLEKETNEIKYCLTKSSVYQVEDNLGPFTVADFNRDGLLDVVFPVLGTSKILIAYNKISLNYDWSADYCETHRNLNLTNIPQVFTQLSTQETNSTVIRA